MIEKLRKNPTQKAINAVGETHGAKYFILLGMFVI